MPEKEQRHPGHRQEEAGTLANMPNFSSCLRLASFTDKFPLGGGSLLCSLTICSGCLSMWEREGGGDRVRNIHLLSLYVCQVGC